MEIKSDEFRKKHLTDETQDYPARLEAELQAEFSEDPDISAPFKCQVAKLFAKYDASFRENLSLCVSPSDAEEFLKMMLKNVKPDDVSSFLEKTCKAVAHRISDAAKALKISSFILDQYWKLVLKSQLSGHSSHGGYKGRIGSLLVHWKVSDIDEVDLNDMSRRYFPQHGTDVITAGLDFYRQKAEKNAGEPLYKVLLRDEKVRLLVLFDEKRNFF